MTTVVNNLMQNVLDYQYNPAGIQRSILQTLTNVTNGTIEIVDPTNPFVFCLESAAVLTSAFMIKNEASTRKQYPYSAQTFEDLYIHMSDKDYVDRFATPSKTKFSILLPKDEVISKMVLDSTTGMRKIIIPRNTYFTIAGINFSLQYPIEIRQLAHGGLQVVYDVSVVSPLQILTTNNIEFEIRRSTDIEFIFFEFDVVQFDIISQKGSLNSATDFKVTINLTDQYYYTRVYTEDVNSQWVEIRTTHTDQIYDVTTPTAVLKVIDNVVTVSIPQIYTSTLMLNKGIRIDVYQTKGPLNLILYEYGYDAFSATWKAYDKNDDTVFTAPLKTLTTVIPYSDQIVYGGSNALLFDDLRLRVIKNAIGSPSLPITNVQIESVLAKQGYEIVRNIDTITNRIFLATKEMPTPINTKLITAAAASIVTLSFTIDDAVLLKSVKDNGSSITITPDTLYQNVNGITNLVPSQQNDYLLSLPVATRALRVTNGNYLYTPFHYVLDMTGDGFNSRPYYLDSPEIETKLFIAENDTTLIQVNTQTYGISKTETGYVIHVVTLSGDAYKALSDDEVHVQLAYIPYGEKDRAYLSGVLVGRDENDERIYEFDLSTNFNVDKQDKLALSKFLMYTEEPRFTGASLKTEFDIIFSTSVLLNPLWVPDSIDLLLGRFLLPARIAAITHEKLRVRFGYALKTLWARARSVISSATYKTYEVDVPRFYESNIYLKDSSGSTITIGADGQIKSTVLHAKGDPVLDDNGVQTYQYYKGDIENDSEGNPIIVNPRGMIRQLDAMLIEGPYWFATDLTAIKYRGTLTNTVVDQLMNDFTSINSQLLEQTRIYYYPKTTLGTIKVMTGSGVVKSIAAGQAFIVSLYVSAITYSNASLRDRLTKTTIKVISDMLKSMTISKDLISTELRAQYGNDVISVQINGLGGIADSQALTIVDDGKRCSIRKRLVALADDSLIVEEDIVVDFIRHELNNI